MYFNSGAGSDYVSTLREGYPFFFIKKEKKKKNSILSAVHPLKPLLV